MKLLEKLTIGGTNYRIIERDVYLELSNAGRATFRVEAKSKPSGLVHYQCGYGGHNTHDFFLGYIERAQPESNKSYTIYCRELCGGLSQTSHISLRNCLITDVIRDISTATHVQFADISPDKQVPRYASHGDGFNALRNIGRVFGLNDFVFYQQIDGLLWMGEWQQSAYAKPDRVIDQRFFTRQTPDSSILPAIPVLRPGMLINGRRLLSHRLTQDHQSLLKWTSSSSVP